MLSTDSESNPVCLQHDYLHSTINMLPSLASLDNIPVDQLRSSSQPAQSISTRLSSRQHKPDRPVHQHRRSDQSTPVPSWHDNGDHQEFDESDQSASADNPWADQQGAPPRRKHGVRPKSGGRSKRLNSLNEKLARSGVNQHDLLGSLEIGSTLIGDQVQHRLCCELWLWCVACIDVAAG